MLVHIHSNLYVRAELVTHVGIGDVCDSAYQPQIQSLQAISREPQPIMVVIRWQEGRFAASFNVDSQIDAEKLVCDIRDRVNEVLAHGNWETQHETA